MSIPNATPEQLASQRRIRRRAADILANHTPFARVDDLVTQRPAIGTIRGAGVVVREALRWSA